MPHVYDQIVNLCRSDSKGANACCKRNGVSTHVETH